MPEASAADLAQARFLEHYNCAQSTLWGVAEARGLGCAECIPAIAWALGGGVGHTGRVCGAVIGAAMAIGLAIDEAVPGSVWDRKDEANRVVGDLVRRFEAEFGSADCAALLGFAWDEPDAVDRYVAVGAKEATCLPCVRWAATEAARLIDDLRSETHRA